MENRVAVALLCGIGFTCLVTLLLGLSSTAVLTALLSAPLLPGGILVTLLARTDEYSPPLLILAANALLYSGAAYVGLYVLGKRIADDKLRLSTLGLVLPVAILVTLACMPAYNPLWPRGMKELVAQETGLRDALPTGIGLETARAVLRAKGIQFQEETETSQTVLVQRRYGSVSAAPGDRVISARIATDAGQFPCGYDIEIALLFGPDERLKYQYVHRLRLCP